MILNDKQEVLAVLRSTPFAFLATCDGSQPRVRPVSPLIEDDLSIYIVTSSTSNKVNEIRQNSRISLAFLQSPEGDTDAVVTGECEIATSMAEKKRVWKLRNGDVTLVEHFPDGVGSEEFCLLRILIEKIEWRESKVSKVDTHVYKPH